MLSWQAFLIPNVFLFNAVEIGIFLPQSVVCVRQWCFVRVTLTQSCQKQFCEFLSVVLHLGCGP